jgi:hypothetical protein
METYLVKVKVHIGVFNLAGEKVFERTDDHEYNSNELFSLGAEQIPGMKDIFKPEESK